jgi:hypothetical protein
MLPRLTAEESMQMANRMAVGTGHLRREDREAIVRQWTRTADAGQPRAVEKATPAALTRMGIQVVKVPKKPKPTPAPEVHGD